jgi:hypothetical protein
MALRVVEVAGAWVIAKADGRFVEPTWRSGVFHSKAVAEATVAFISEPKPVAPASDEARIPPFLNIA